MIYDFFLASLINFNLNNNKLYYIYPYQVNITIYHVFILKNIVY